VFKSVLRSWGINAVFIAVIVLLLYCLNLSIFVM